MSALVTMYSHLGDISSAVGVLDDAVEHAQKNKVSKRETGAILYWSISLNLSIMAHSPLFLGWPFRRGL